MTKLKIEVVIPVHNATRPIARAVASVLGARSDEMRATVVCHNIDAAEIAVNLGKLAQDPRLVLVELFDSEPTPAAPRNFAIQHSHAEYLLFLDSDDEFDVGALDGWSAELQDRPDLLIGQLSSDSAGRILAPSPRPGVFAALDAVADLLNYRTAPLGVVIRRELLLSAESPGYLPGFRTAEDLALGLYLWNYAADVRYSRVSSGYRIREDGTDRVTGAGLTPAETFAATRAVTMQPLFTRLSKRRRQAIAIKLVRIQVFGFLWGKHSTGSLDSAHLAEASETLTDLFRFAPGTIGFLNWGERRLIHAVHSRQPAHYATELERIARTPAYFRLVSVNPMHSFSPESERSWARRGVALQSYFGPL